MVRPLAPGPHHLALEARRLVLEVRVLVSLPQAAGREEWAEGRRPEEWAGAQVEAAEVEAQRVEAP